jgi:diguanylate cyclase (GGDEF)-like protein/PAS domain S-box-containing protein
MFSQDLHAFRGFVENTPDPMIRYDRECRRLYANPAATKLASRTSEKLVGKTPADQALLDQHQSERLMAAIRSVFALGERQELLLSYVDPDGKYRDHHLVLIPEHDSNGTVATVLASARDVTKIRRNAPDQTQFFDIAPGLFYTLTRQANGHYHMSFANTGIYDLYGVSPEAVINDFSALLALIYPGDIEMRQQKLDESERDLTPFRVDYRIIHPQKGLRWLEVHSHPQRLPDGSTHWNGFVHDITDRKQLEEALAIREQEFRNLAENSPDTIMRYDRSCRRIYVNPAFVKQIGKPAEELLGGTPTEYSQSPQAVLYQAALQRALESGCEINHEYTWQTVTGSIVVSDFRIVPERDQYGNITNILTIGRDITERKRMENALKKERAVLKAFFDAMPALAWMKDKDGRYLACNPQFEQFYGATEAEILGKTDFDFVDAELATFFRRKDKEAESAGKPCVNEEWIRFAVDGRKALVETVKCPVQDAEGKVIGIIGVAHDITERKRLEDSLKESLGFSRELIEAIPGPVFYKDANGIYLGCNAAFERAYGIPRDKLIGKSVFDLWPRDLAERYDAADRQLIQNPGTQMYEAQMQTSEGRRDVVFHKATFNLADGSIGGQIGVILDITERKRAEESLQQSEQRMRSLLDATPDWIFIKDQEHRYQLVNQGYADALHIAPEEFIGKNDLELGFPEELVKGNPEKGIRGFWADDRLVMDSNEKQVYPDDPATIDGEVHTFHTVKLPLRDAHGKPWGVLAFARDITEQKRVEKELRRQFEQIIALNDQLEEIARSHEEHAVELEASQEQLKETIEFTKGIINAIPDLLFEVDREGRYLNVWTQNQERQAVWQEIPIGKTAHQVLSTESAATMMAGIREAEEAGVSFGKVISMNLSGEEHWFELSISCKPAWEPSTVSFLVLSRNVTERKLLEERIHQMAFYDALTKLPNRVLFNERLHQMLTESSRHGHRSGVMLLDLDRFKMVNDTMGHAAGDLLLQETGARLRSCLRCYDTVARLGGDEFAILLPEIRSDEDMGRIAANILEVFKKPFLLENKEVYVSASIGIAAYPSDSHDANELVKHADSAMYSAKRSGRNAFRFYSRDLTDSANERLSLEADLRHGFEQGHLELYYQPKIRLSDGLVQGSEALLRWHHPTLGLVPPDKFIPIAEDSGQIIEIGAWVLHEACRTARQWNRPGMPRHKVAINLSARQFQCGDLTRIVRDALAETGCRAEWIELEITESLLLDENGKTLDVLKSFQEMGITIAIDDFGTGYSSLSYLARFPIDTIKIDRSFTSRATQSRHHAELIKAMISIAYSLQQQIVAEGVETAEEALFLQAHGCHLAQGYLYGKPMPMGDFSERFCTLQE